MEIQAVVFAIGDIGDAPMPPELLELIRSEQEIGRALQMAPETPSNATRLSPTEALQPFVGEMGPRTIFCFS